jgi:hypothetical protein
MPPSSPLPGNPSPTPGNQPSLPSQGAQDSQSPQSQGFFGWIGNFDKQLPSAARYSWLWVVPIVVLLGIGSIPIYAQFVPASYSAWNVVGSALMFGGAAFLGGGLVGLLFGIPKAATSAAQADSPYTANTNLEQISDWLTKIVVGLTLIELGRIPGALGKLADDMKTPLGGQESSAAFGLALVIFYAVLGFFYLYLWSRTLLMAELSQSDLAAQGSAQDNPQAGPGGTAA